MQGVTVLISSSPCHKHPGVEMIDETIRSIRQHDPLSNARIIVMQDGVRPEHEELRERYNEYLRKLATKMLWSYGKVAMFPFMDWKHQAAMTRETLKLVETPVVLFVEHDTPLMERFIDWEFLTEMLVRGGTNHIRLHYDETIHPEHEHMMRGNLHQHLIKTVQWHNRPYLTRTDWFLNQLYTHFSPEARCFIEDRIYSPISYSEWEDYKLTIYDPNGDGKDMKRSRDLNGRGGAPKFDDSQVW